MLLHTFKHPMFLCHAPCCRVCWLQQMRSSRCVPEWMASYLGAQSPDGLYKTPSSGLCRRVLHARLPVTYASFQLHVEHTNACDMKSRHHSNHGGRQCDCVPAAVEMLPHVIDAIGHVVPLIVDGGIRRGTDVLKVTAGL